MEYCLTFRGKGYAVKSKDGRCETVVLTTGVVLRITGWDLTKEVPTPTGVSVLREQPGYEPGVPGITPTREELDSLVARYHGFIANDS